MPIETPGNPSEGIQPILRKLLLNQAVLQDSIQQLVTGVGLDSQYRDFGAVGNLGAALGSVVEIENDRGYSSIGFKLVVPTGGVVIFEGRFGDTWENIVMRGITDDRYKSISEESGNFVGSIGTLRAFRVRVILAGSAPGSVLGRMQRPVHTLEGIERYVQSVDFADSLQQDSFGRVRTSTPILLFDAQPHFGSLSLLFNIVTTPGGTLTALPNQSAIQLAVDTTANASVLSRSKAHFSHQPSRGMMIEQLFKFGPPQANVTQRLGYGSPTDGVFLQMDAAGAVSLLLRNSSSGVSVETLIPQGEWNVDQLDGNGASTILVDWTKIQTLSIDFQWPGRVRIGLLFGTRILAHVFETSNRESIPLFHPPNLPVYFETVAAGVAGAPTGLTAYAVAVQLDGGNIRERGYQFSADTGVTPRSFTTTAFPVLAVRPSATFNGIVNTAQALLESIDMLPESGTGSFRYQLLYNPTITGGAWIAANANSSSEYNVSATAVSGGISIVSGHINASNQLRLPQNIIDTIVRYPWVLDNLGVQIPVCIACTALSGTISASAAMQWRELR